MKITKLQEILQDALNDIEDCIEDYGEDAEVRLESNTYFLGNARYFIGISGYDGGYLNLRDIEDNIRKKDEEE